RPQDDQRDRRGGPDAVPHPLLPDCVETSRHRRGERSGPLQSLCTSVPGSQRAGHHDGRQGRTAAFHARHDSANGNAAADATGGWLGCVGTNHTGTVTFLDYAQDAEGNLERLALDFDDTCDQTVTLGSIRYHSAVPI